MSRGRIPWPSFGHTGFTGTSLWIDPVVGYLRHPARQLRASPRQSTHLPLRGEVATAAAKALGVGSDPTHRDETAMNGAPDVDCHAPGVNCDTISSTPGPTLTGIDLLEATNFAALKDAAARNGGHLRIGLLTNQTGIDAQGRRTIDVLRGIGNGIELTTLFSPEHGLFGAKDSTRSGRRSIPRPASRSSASTGQRMKIAGPSQMICGTSMPS